MSRPLYVPDSDCECYKMALDLLNDAIQPFIDRLEDIERGYNRR